jgi:DNA-directed RNA polymerase specialized sigma24 family protein
MSSGDPLNKKVFDRLEVISRLLALSLVKDVKSKQEQVQLLDEAGLSPYEIGDLLGIKTGTVHVTLFNIRQAKNKARKAKSGK